VRVLRVRDYPKWTSLADHGGEPLRRIADVERDACRACLRDAQDGGDHLR
jgi:hypothetical protein